MEKLNPPTKHSPGGNTLTIRFAISRWSNAWLAASIQLPSASPRHLSRAAEVLKMLAFLLLTLPASAQYTKYKLHTPAALQVVGGVHSDFPVLIDLTDDDLRHTGNGGFVTSANGYDIEPASNAQCTSKLKFQREAYDGTAGRIRMHAKEPSLSSGTNVYLCFGNSAITTDQQDAANTWNSGFVCVWHFGDGSTLNLASSTSTDCTFTNSSATAAAGQIYGALAMNSGSSQYVYRDAAVVSATPLTITAWLKSSTTTGVQPAFTIQSFGSNLNMFRLILYQDKVQAQVQAVPGPGSALAATSANYSTSNWFHAAAVFASSTSRTAYYNGGSSGSDTTSITPAGLGKSQTRTEAVDEYFDGSVDELRVSNVARSADWIATEYNAGTPSTFWTVGPTTNVGAQRRRIIIVNEY